MCGCLCACVCMCEATAALRQAEEEGVVEAEDMSRRLEELRRGLQGKVALTERE